MLWWLTQQTLMVAALAGLSAGLCRLRRVSPAMRHALWLLVLVKFMTPPLVSWPWSPHPSAPGKRAEPPAALRQPIPDGPLEVRTPVPDPVRAAEKPHAGSAPAQPILSEVVPPQPHGRQDATPFEPDTPGRVTTAFAPTVPGPGQAEPGEPAGGVPAWLGPAALSLWLAGSTLVGSLHVVRALRFRRRLAEARPAPSWLACELEAWAARLGVRAPPAFVLAGIGSPLVWSLGRPALYWPASLVSSLPDRCREAVLVHELAHLRRRDHWVGWLQVLAACLWWWHPLFWYVRRRLRASAELACDAWVLWALPQARRAYAEALIEVSERVSGPAAPVPALGIGGGRQDFERRLTMIMRETVACRVSRGGLLALGALALIALPAWSLGQDKKSDDQPKQQKTLGQDKKADTQPGQQQGADQDKGVDQGKPLISPGEDTIGTAPVGDRDRRLAAVERQLQALLKEVQSLRGGSADRGRSADYLNVKRGQAVLEADDVALNDARDLSGSKRAGGRGGVQVITLTRARYQLPQSRATALSAFLREHCKVDMLDLKIGPNEITVTATPEAQKAIGQLIGIMRQDEVQTPDNLKVK
jgi:beta-lactamase regulating signal transducer with metallopeptidase domain